MAREVQLGDDVDVVAGGVSQDVPVVLLGVVARPWRGRGGPRPQLGQEEVSLVQGVAPSRAHLPARVTGSILFYRASY